MGKKDTTYTCGQTNWLYRIIIFISVLIRTLMEICCLWLIIGYFQYNYNLEEIIITVEKS